MSRFNYIPSNRTVNLANGHAFKSSPELELVSMLLTSFIQDSFYEKASTQLGRMDTILSQVDPEFAAKAAIYARTVFGMRSITHVMASKLAKYASGKSWAKIFYRDIVNRPDDMTEILSHYRTHSKPMPNAMKKGFASYLRNMDKYSYGKYTMDKKGLSLVDLVNLTHPKPTLKSEEALKKLVRGENIQANTWQTRLSSAGADKKAKAETWMDLLKTDKLGYFAALRNVRNVLEQAPEAVDLLIQLLTDPNRIKASKVLPFRYVVAYNAVNELPASTLRRKVLIAITRALDICLDNVPTLQGRTLILLDASGSMYSAWGNTSTLDSEFKVKSPIAMAALFAAALYKRTDSDILLYSSDVRKVSFNPLDTTLSIAEGLIKAGQRGGTDLTLAFKAIEQYRLRYDRIIVLSDMQSWVGFPDKALASYKKSVNVDPFIYSMDFKGYGTLEFPERNVITLAGYSDKLFDLFPYAEQDKQVLINTIKSYSWK